MRAQLIPLLRCPAGGGPLELETPAGDWIEEGMLVCRTNGRRYPIRAGMPRLYTDDERWQPKAREAAGWVQFHKDRQIYDQTDVDIDFQLPYFPHQPWLDIARQFDICLELIAPRQGMWVLDVGAGRGWAAKQLALRGCNAVAIEVNPDDQIGLGRSNAIMAQAGVRFDALIGDSENLPFADGSFDVVFAAAALHHTSDLDLLLQNARRVLRPAGRLVAMNEPCVADTTSEEELARIVAEEREYGINEGHPRLDGYRQALRNAGLQEQGLFAWPAWTMSEANWVQWSGELGVEGPERFVQQPRALARLLRGWQSTRRTTLFPPQRWMDNLLRRKGGGIILVATRQ